MFYRNKFPLDPALRTGPGSNFTPAQRWLSGLLASASVVTVAVAGPQPILEAVIPNAGSGAPKDVSADRYEIDNGKVIEVRVNPADIDSAAEKVSVQVIQ